MSISTERCTVLFPEWYDERGEWEAQSKGWLQGVRVRLTNGSEHPLFFYEPVRLAQDLEEETSSGRPYIAQPGMVVIPQITRETIERVVSRLAENGYFEQFTVAASLNAALNGAVH